MDTPLLDAQYRMHDWTPVSEVVTPGSALPTERDDSLEVFCLDSPKALSREQVLASGGSLGKVFLFDLELLATEADLPVTSGGFVEVLTETVGDFPAGSLVLSAHVQQDGIVTTLQFLARADT